jgi:hypothetical protein
MELLLPEMSLILWVLFMILIPVLTVLALISALRSNFSDSTTKLIWVIVIIMVPFFGPIIYFIIGRRQRIRPA